MSSEQSRIRRLESGRARRAELTNAFFTFIAGTIGVDPINFDSASEFVSTSAKCGIVKPIIDNLRDFPEA